MAIQHKYQRIPLEKIYVERDQRQRREIETSDLELSIAKRGVLSPILVHAEPDGKFKLIFGERRFTASQRLKLPDIPARISNNLSATELQIIELEENLRRKDLYWKDFCGAIFNIHKLYMDSEPNWNLDLTAQNVGYDPSYLGEILRIQKELLTNDQRVHACNGINEARNHIRRRDGRMVDDAINDLLGGEPEPKEEPHEEIAPPSNSSPSHPSVPQTKAPAVKPIPVKRRDDILCTDFTTWVNSYSGPPFTFIHCDFPYGVGLDSSAQGNSAQWGGYKDGEEVYWNLISILCKNMNKLMAPYSHLLFWLSSDIEVMFETIERFSTDAPELHFQPKPLIWHKTDNKGILADPKRGTRHVYETALFASRGDRHIITSVSDAYGAPTSKEIHQSEKPEPVLRHFLRMFVDDSTTMFDPTCGSGTSLRAAESLGAKSVLGLEINPEWADAANAKLRTFRALRAAHRATA